MYYIQTTEPERSEIAQLCANPTLEHDQQAEHQGADQHVSAIGRKNRRLNCGRKTTVENTFDAEGQRVDNAADRINDRGYSRIGGAHQGQAFRNRENARLLKMLI